MIQIGGKDGKIYDPSYGKGPFDNRKAWEDASVAGFTVLDKVAENNFRLIFRKNLDPVDIAESKRIAIPAS